MDPIVFNAANFFAGCLVLLSLSLLYQSRLPSLISTFSAQSFVLALSIAWQANVQHAPHLLLTAGIEFVFKTLLIPLVLFWVVRHLKIHRTVEIVVGVGATMLIGMLLVGLAMALMMRTSPGIGDLARQDLAFALSVVLLGMLMMVTRRNVVSQVIGFMSIDNGLVLAATGARGMPFVVETSVAFSVLIALIVIGLFLFRIRERFDSMDVAMLDQFRGER